MEYQGRYIIKNLQGKLEKIFKKNCGALEDLLGSILRIFSTARYRGKLFSPTFVHFKKCLSISEKCITRTLGILSYFSEPKMLYIMQ